MTIDNMEQEVVYETPQVEILQLEGEQAFAVSQTFTNENYNHNGERDYVW
jgi:hypothetical protein